MASNSFGTLFKITTWGESHGKAIGVVIDGCPAGLEITDEEIQTELALRAPGKNAYTTPRKEKDLASIYSGTFEGKTTGAPISIIIFNRDCDSSNYEPIKNTLRPGHANFTYLEKYGVFDYRGGGRASARETACRVAAGAVAKKLLRHYFIQTTAFLSKAGDIEIEKNSIDTTNLKNNTLQSPIFCPDEQVEQKIIDQITSAKTAGDSIGGIVSFLITGLPAGLGDPLYEKLEANLAKAMLSLPASKGFEIGEGFQAACQKGSEHNDVFLTINEKVHCASNHAGGILGGISTGMPLYGRVAFKPTSSISIVQKSVNLQGEAISFELPEGSRHDPCVAIRAVPVVEAMCSLVIADALLLQRSARLS